jgi:predicted alpha/beta superfamily hydrolase
VKPASCVLSAVALVVLALPALAGEPITIGERVTIASRVLGEVRTILVSTPPGYGRGQRRFPVLYLTDGDAHFTLTRGTVDFLARQGLMPQLIIVGIVNTDRTRDLTPTSVTSLPADGRILRFPIGGGAANFLKFIETELVPYVESNYRTEPFRIFCGHSFGGLFALYALLTRPELFNALIAASPTPWWDDGVMLKRGKEFFAQRKELKRTFFTTLGNEGRQARTAFDALARILKRNHVAGFRWGSMVLDKESHGSTVLLSYYHGLRKIFEGWAMPVDPATGDVSGTVADVRKHYAELSERLGFAVKPDEATVNRMGYSALRRNDRTRALELFRFNVATHPDSANVYDSLGEALEADGQLDLALENYRRAYEIASATGDPNAPVFKHHLERLAGTPAQPE